MTTPQCFVVPGQGLPLNGLRRALSSRPSLLERFIRISQSIDTIRGRTLLEWVSSTSPPTDTDIVQPVAVAVALAVGNDLDARADLLIGHSVGEIAAVCLAGSIDIHGAVEFAAKRGAAMHSLMLPGAMTVVAAPANVVEALIVAMSSRVAVAAVNSDRATVIAGMPQDVAEFAVRARDSGLASIPVASTRAFHTTAVEPAIALIRAAASDAGFGPTTTDIISTTDGAIRRAGWTPDEAHWVAQAMGRVEFHVAIAAAVERGSQLVEIWPTPGLARSRPHWERERWSTFAEARSTLLE